MFDFFKFFKPPPTATSSIAEDSDFGRRYGWFVEREGIPTGELDYIRWDSSSQFWHEYRLTWFDPANAIVGTDAWIAAKLTLRNRRYLEVVIDGFLTSPEHSPGVIAVRGAHVDEAELRRGRRTKNSVFDVILGLLVYSEDDDRWEGTMLIGENRVRLLIGGDDSPSPALIAHARDIAGDSAAFATLVRDFLATEAEAAGHRDVANEIQQLTLESICLLSPERPYNGMLYFHGPDDERRLWRCDYIERKPRGLGFDS
jgi:hypothetical protein